MSFAGIANPEQLATLRWTVDEYCSMRGIVESARREEVAAAILALYSSGVETSEAIIASLDSSPILRHSKLPIRYASPDSTRPASVRNSA